MRPGESAELEADLLVIGGGMAGLTAAARAAQRGATVMVIERAEHLGGSALLSEGYVWAPPSLDLVLEEDPDCDAELAQIIVADLPKALSWLTSLGDIVLQLEVTDMMRRGFGRGLQLDVAAFVRRAVAIVESGGGFVVRQSRPSSLLLQDGVVCGAVVVSNDASQSVVRAPWILLATGGFQASASRVGEWITHGGEPLLLRSNMLSDGEGLALGLDVGGVLTQAMDGFYGHLLPSPLQRRLTRSDLAGLAQYHSERCVLVNRLGRRFVDESLGDHISTQETVKQPGSRAVLLCDERIVRDYVMPPFVRGMDAGVDKLAAGGEAGARYAARGSLRELIDVVATWGVDRSALAATVDDYNRLAETERLALDPPRLRHAYALLHAPFRALEVQPAITFTYGGLRIDGRARVINRTGVPVPGLLAAGADGAGPNRRGYFGGLARSLVFGLRAGELSTSPLEPAAQP